MFLHECLKGLLCQDLIQDFRKQGSDLWIFTDLAKQPKELVDIYLAEHLPFPLFYR